MNISVDCKDLLKELSVLQGVVEKRHAMPILSNLMLSGVKGELTLSATDLEVGMRTRLPAEVKKEGKCLVPFQALFKAAGNAAEGGVHIKKAKEQIEVKFDKGAVYKFAAPAVDDYPLEPKRSQKIGRAHV